MAFFTKSVLSLESLELTNGQPVSKSSDMQAKTFRCTILKWLGVHSACKLFLIVMKPGVGKLITTSHPISTLIQSRNLLLSLFFHRF